MLAKQIDGLEGLSTRARHVMAKEGMTCKDHVLRRIVYYPDFLLDIPGCGERTAAEILNWIDAKQYKGIAIVLGVPLGKAQWVADAIYNAERVLRAIKSRRL